MTFNSQPPTEYEYPDILSKNANLRYNEMERKESVVTAERGSSLERPDTGLRER